MECDVCHKVLHKDNQIGVCKGTPECAREWKHRWWGKLTSDQRAQYRINSLQKHPFTDLLRNTRYRAKNSGIPFNLTEETIPELFAQCPCCGVKMDKNGEWKIQPSLDRIYPQKGYTVGNVQWLCRRCNLIKSNATPDELMMVALFMKGQKWNC